MRDEESLAMEGCWEPGLNLQQRAKAGIDWTPSGAGGVPGPDSGSNYASARATESQYTHTAPQGTLLHALYQDRVKERERNEIGIKK